MRPGAGHGWLLSFEFTGGLSKAKKFYDALPVCKGPSLGTSFTLVCLHGVDRPFFDSRLNLVGWILLAGLRCLIDPTYKYETKISGTDHDALSIASR